ncbi:carboxypeptidase-like regulatory domain-containing protein, partial [bacterium]|nr:carboxypeptidase-like regulatory domain-containing protein [bacterium]
SVAVALYGYEPVAVESVACDGTPLELALDRNFARVLGRLTVIDGSVPADEIEVAATNTSFAGGSRSAIPDVLGAYEILDLRPGSYVLTAANLGCVTTPAQVTLVLGEGDLVTGLDFEIELAVIDHVDISGETQVVAGDEITFSASAVSDDGQLIDTELEWWISPESAGEMARESRCFTASDDYLGEFSVSARDAITGLTGRIEGTVYATIGPMTSATFADSTGMTISFAQGSVSETKSIYLSHDELPDAKRCTRDLTIVGADYHLKPHGLIFEEDRLPLMTLPMPTDDAYMVRWNKSLLEWNDVDANRIGDTVEASIASLTEFAAAMA